MARQIMREAQCLNMVGGHFIWLWADTSSTTEFYDVSSDPIHTSMDFSTPMRRNDRKDPTLSDHLEHLEGRKMDFEDFNLPNRERERHDGSDLRSSKRERNLGRKKPHHKNQKDEKSRGRRDSVDQRGEEKGKGKGERAIEQNIYNESDNNEDDDDEEQDVDVVEGHGEDFFEYESDESSQMEHTQDQQNGTSSDNEGSARLGLRNPFDKPGSEKPASVIDPVTYEESKVNLEDDNLKPKRTTPNMVNVSDSHVLFHHFKDFPIGLLALRPIRMNVDRHFIRSAVRFFASNWARLEFAVPLNSQPNNNGDANSSANFYGKTRNHHRTKEKNFSTNWGADEPHPSSAPPAPGSHPIKRSIYQHREISSVKDDDDGKVGKVEVGGSLSSKLGDTGNKSMVFNETGSMISAAVNLTNGAQKQQQQQVWTQQSVVNSTLNLPTQQQQQYKQNTQLNQSFNASDLTYVKYIDSSQQQQEQQTSGSGRMHISQQPTNSANRINNTKPTTTNNNESGLKITSVSNSNDYDSSNGDEDDYEVITFNMDNQQSNNGNANESGKRPIKRQTSWRSRPSAWTTKPGYASGRRIGGPQYRGGCYGVPNKGDVKRADNFAK